MTLFENTDLAVLKRSMRSAAPMLCIGLVMALSRPAWAVNFSEIHYDNAGTDTGEFFELEDDMGTDLTGWTVHLYNGSNGTVYNVVSLSGTFPAAGAGAIAFGLPTNGLQNGSPDGLALVNPSGTVEEFISYEGTLTAVSGPASGLTSVDIGVQEGSSTAIGDSLQLIGTSWTGPLPETRGVLNSGGTPSPPASVFISEIHYDNVGTDQGEFIEVEGDSGTDLTGWTVVLYNGSNGTAYSTLNLSGTLGGSVRGVVVLTLPSNGIQNGSPDGLALVDASGTVVEFISYEGTFTAVGGPANGTMSTDIGVSEVSSTPVGESLQRIGGVWIGPGPNTEGALNSDRRVAITEIHYDNAGTDTGEFVEVSGPAGIDLTGWNLVLYNGNGGSLYNTRPLSGTLPNENAGRGALDFAIAGIQNGSPDGVALVDPNGSVVEFLSYEGSFTAVGGPANGLSSTDIGVSESSSTPAGQSLQLISGSWVGPRPESPGILNTLPPSIRRIHEIQGSGLASPLVGQTVTIEGIVVGDFVDIATGDPSDRSLGGFFVQEEDADADTNPSTSEGLFVFAPSATVNVGDRVQVTGDVVEFFDLTELTSVSSITVVSSANPLPTPATPRLPVTSGDPLVDWEAIEGMSVRFTQTLFVTGLFPLGAFGEIQLSAIGAQDHPNQTNLPGSTAATAQRALNLASRVILDDGEDEDERFPQGLSTWNPTPTPYLLAPENTIRSGDEVRNLFGVVNYDFGEYEVLPVNVANPLDPDGAVTAVRVQPRPGVPNVGGSLKVASFNVLNYFTTIDTGGARCGPPGNQQGCRGADTQAEFAIQSAKIVDALLDIDADIVGLIEIENNGGVATADLVNRLNTSPNARRTYGYVNTGFLGTDAIAVAFIYDTTTVALQGSFAPLDSSVSPAYIDNRNRVSLAQTFREVSTGASLTVLVNHLKSKGSACTNLSNPGDTNFGVLPYSSDPEDPNLQGNCNLTRTAAAKVLGQWLASQPTGQQSLNLLIIGDLNAYANEDPIRELEAQSYIDLLERAAGGNGFAQGGHSYVFDGEHGTLDYAMGNPCLADRVQGVAAWHINADEPFAIDYQNFNPPGQATLDEFKSSDHDPILVGLDLTASCVDDTDGDGIPNETDLCEGDNSTGDLDQDGICNDRDDDIDGDKVINTEDPEPNRFGPFALKFGENELYGTFGYNGQTYEVTIPLDQVRYGNGNRHKAWTKPEEYRKTVTPAFTGPGFRVTCEGLEGPGVKGFAGSRPQAQCTWKAGNGNAPSGTFSVRSRSTRGTKPVPTFFRGFHLDAKTLRGDIVYRDATYPVSLELDVVDYRNGNDHKAFIRAQYTGNRLDTSSLAGTGISVRSCDVIHPRGRGTDGVFGRAPTVTCQWKKGNGRQPPENLGEVTLR